MKAILERIELMLSDFLTELRHWNEANALHCSCRGMLPAPEVWLTKDAVMDFLCVSERTFARRKAEDNWTMKKSGGTWYYLKSSLL